MGGSSSVVTGYRFYLGIHMVACHGPIDALHRVYFGDRVAHTEFLPAYVRTGPSSLQIYYNNPANIVNPNLYGGDALEGGIQGGLSFRPGWDQQPADPYLVGQLGANNISGHRGVVSLISNQMYLGNSPFIKAITAIMSRIGITGMGQIQWDYDKAFIRDPNHDYSDHSADSDMNPAHIIHECLNNSIWGLNQPVNKIDGASFQAAAQIFYDEGFGISLKWTQESDVREFMEVVQSHCNADVFTDPNTGLWKIVPIRGNYDRDELLVIDDDDIIEYEEVTRREYSECINSITVDFTDLNTNNRRSVTVHNIAAIQQLGQINSSTVYYKGLTREDLALRVGVRDLLTLGYPLTSGRIQVTRRKGYRLSQAGVFVMNAPDYNIFGEVMRVISVDYGTDRDHSVTIEFTQDIYSLDTSGFVSPESPDIPNIVEGSEPIADRYVEEAPYYIWVRQQGDATVNQKLAEDPYGGVLLTAAARSSAYALGYVNRISEDQGATWLTNVRSGYSPSMTLTVSAAIPNAINTIDAAYTTSQNLTELSASDFPLIGVINRELVYVESINQETKRVIFRRGSGDTIPFEHAAGSELIVLQNFSTLIEDDYTSGVGIHVKLQPYGLSGQLSLEQSYVDNVLFRHRAIRPYPPGFVLINGAYTTVIANWSGTINVAWAHRDRTQQTARTPNYYTQNNIGPETGVTYRVTIRQYDDLDNQIGGDSANTVVTPPNNSVSINLSNIPLNQDTAYAELMITSERDGFVCMFPFTARYYVDGTSYGGTTGGDPFGTSTVVNPGEEPDPGGGDPDPQPEWNYSDNVPSKQYAQESAYYLLVKQYGAAATNALLASNSSVGRIYSAMKRLLTTDTGFTTFLKGPLDADYTPKGSSAFDAAVRITSAIPFSKESITVSYADETDFSELTRLGVLVAVNNELMVLNGLDQNNKTMTLLRGACDTIPQSHPANSYAILLENDGEVFPDDYTNGQVIEAKLVPYNANEQADISLIDPIAITMRRRAFAPYPLADITIESFPPSIYGTTDGYYSNVISPGFGDQLTISFAYKNRLTDTATTPVFFQSTPQAAEPGMLARITIRAFDANDIQVGGTIRDHSFPTDSSPNQGQPSQDGIFAVTLSTSSIPYAGLGLRIDSELLNIPVGASYVEVRIASVRDGVECVQPFVARYYG